MAEVTVQPQLPPNSAFCREIINEGMLQKTAEPDLRRAGEMEKCRIVLYKILGSDGRWLKWSKPSQEMTIGELFTTHRHSYIVCCEK